MDNTRRTRSQKPTVQLTAPRCTDLAGDARAIAELILSASPTR